MSTSSISLHVYDIPQKGAKLFADEESMRSAVDFSGIVIQSLGAVGSQSNLIPILNILSAPLYLYHAINEARERLQLLKLSLLTSQTAKSIFWMGRSIDAMGTAISDTVQPFAGGAQLTGLINFAPIAVLFSFVIPVLLIVFGAVGGVWEGWAMTRTSKAFKNLSKMSKDCKGSISKLLFVLEYLNNEPQTTMNSEEARLKQELAQKEMEKIYFTNDSRCLSIQKKIRDFLGRANLDTEKIKSSLQNLRLNESLFCNMGHFSLIKDIEALYEELLKAEVTLNTLDHVEELYKKIVEGLRDSESNGILSHSAHLTAFIEELESRLKEVSDFKTVFLKQGNVLIGIEKSELNRKLCSHSIIILMSALVLISGTLYLDPRYQTIASILGITSSTVDILFIVLNKTISEEQFYRLHAYFNSLMEEKKISENRIKNS